MEQVGRTRDRNHRKGIPVRAQGLRSDQLARLQELRLLTALDREEQREFPSEIGGAEPGPNRVIPSA